MAEYIITITDKDLEKDTVDINLDSKDVPEDVGIENTTAATTLTSMLVADLKEQQGFLWSKFSEFYELKAQAEEKALESALSEVAENAPVDDELIAQANLEAAKLNDAG